MDKIKNQFIKEDNHIKETIKNVFKKDNLMFAFIITIIGLIIHAELLIREVSNPDSIAARICVYSRKMGSFSR